MLNYVNEHSSWVFTTSKGARSLVIGVRPYEVDRGFPVGGKDTYYGTTIAFKDQHSTYQAALEVHDPEYPNISPSLIKIIDDYITLCALSAVGDSDECRRVLREELLILKRFLGLDNVASGSSFIPFSRGRWTVQMPLETTQATVMAKRYPSSGNAYKTELIIEEQPLAKDAPFYSTRRSIVLLDTNPVPLTIERVVRALNAVNGVPDKK